MTSDRGQPAVALDRGGAMPLVGLGTWQMTGARCQAAVRAALDVGYRHIDTATMYGNEREVGRAVRNSGVPRDQVSGSRWRATAPSRTPTCATRCWSRWPAATGSPPPRWWSAGTSTTRWW